MTSPTTVDEYLAALPDEPRAALEQLRATIRAAAPEATETLSYKIPTFVHRGRLLLSYAAFKRHYSLFPASEVVRERLGQELAPYLAGKGTIRVPADRPIPLDLVARVVAARIAEVEAAQRARGSA